jgi:alpha-beta hydrolase superfamily lysophospholipase
MMAAMIEKTNAVSMVHGDGPAYRTYFFALKKCFLRAGYVALMWDKPGFGQSKGKFSRQHLKAEGAEILLDAIRHIKSHLRIDSDLYLIAAID